MQLPLEDSSTYPRPLPGCLPDALRSQVLGKQLEPPYADLVPSLARSPSELSPRPLHCELCSLVFPNKLNWVWPDSFIFIFPEPEQCPIKLGESE